MRETFAFLSADGQTQIHGVRWTPEGEPRFVMQLVHGMVEFIDRYGSFAEFLASHGILVVGHDHLGHGDSVISKDKWGFMTADNPSGVLVEDMHAVRTLTQKRYPDLPYFILGHSMGSYLLRKYLALHGEGLAGAVIMGTGFVAPGMAGFGKSLCGALANLRGWEHRSGMIAGLAMGGGAYKQFDSTGKEPERSWLTHDTAIVDKYYKEPRCNFRFTLSGYKGLFEAVAFSCDPKNVALIPKDLPLLLTSGDQDPVGDMGEGVRKVDALLRKAGVKDVTLKLWPGDRHEILNELDREAVYADILQWLEAHLPKGGDD